MQVVRIRTGERDDAALTPITADEVQRRALDPHHALTLPCRPPCRAGHQGGIFPGGEPLPDPKPDSMPLNQHSRAITEGDQRAPNRAMLRAVGFGDGDFAKPIVGIANGYSTITPCNAGLDVLAHRAEAAISAGGGMPQMFGTITVSDGISMGTEGMKYSLVSREVIADAIETACGAQSMDGVTRRRRVRQEHAGCHDRDGADEHPRGVRLRRDHQAGAPWRARPHGRERLRGGGPARRRQPRAAEFEAVERKACPGAGSCGGMFTANTMSSVFEAMGMSLPGSSTMAAEDAEKAESAAQSAEALLVVHPPRHHAAPDPDA